jgi:hypothetical protein
MIFSIRPLILGRRFRWYFLAAFVGAWSLVVAPDELSMLSALYGCVLLSSMVLADLVDYSVRLETIRLLIDQNQDASVYIQVLVRRHNLHEWSLKDVLSSCVDTKHKDRANELFATPEAALAQLNRDRVQYEQTAVRVLADGLQRAREMEAASGDDGVPLQRE